MNIQVSFCVRRIMLFRQGLALLIVLDATNDSAFCDKTQRQWLENELREGTRSQSAFCFHAIYSLLTPEVAGVICQREIEMIFRSFSHVIGSRTYLLRIYTGISQGCGEESLTPSPVGPGQGSREATLKHFFHHYMKVHVNEGKVDTTIRRIDAENIMVSFYDSMENHAFDAGLLLCAGACLLTAWLPMRKRRMIQNG